MSKQLLIDLNEIPTDENSTYVHYNETNFEKESQSTKEVLYEPFIGQCFLSEEEAFAFYQNYAKSNGFSIRKGRFANKNGEKKRRDFFCHRQGKPEAKMVDHSIFQRNRISTRCECKAYMRITLRRVNEMFPKEWHVTSLVLDHNHVLLSTNEVRFLPSYRSITNEDEKRMVMLKECGLSVRQIMRVMEVENNVQHGHLNFLTKDVHNFFGKLRQMHAQNDAKDLLEFCNKSKSENPNFQYAFTIDEERKLEHFFWSPVHCFDLYQKYGDVVAFDTTYKVNSYDMPFGIFVGIDNHGRTILFGCALLRNEKKETFMWLFKKFVSLMTHSPKTILTDQDHCITEAIANIMPFTKHAFCIWHITSKFSGWFNSILRSDYSSWCSEFYSLYRLDTIEEFEQQWPRVITMYNLDENKHVKGLYEIKRFWVPAYLRCFFFGGMRTTGRSESINAFIKRFISRNTCLTQFIRQVDLAIEDVEQSQVHDTMLEKYRGSCMRSVSPLEEQGYHFFTSFAFKKFQDEFARAIQYIVQEQTFPKFFVKHHKATQSNGHEVVWDGNIAKCSCKFFEFVGILCRHILSVLIHKNCFSIPPTYFLPRWSRKEVSPSHEISFVNSTSMNDERGSDVVDMVNCPPVSKTKGRPKEKRMKGGMESSKHVRTCRLCKGVGHNISTCPEKEKLGNIDPSSTRAIKKKKAMLEYQDLNPVFSLKF